MAVDMPPPPTREAPWRVDASCLPTEYAHALESILAGVDELAGLGTGALDGPMAATVTTALASLTSRLEVLSARMLPVVEVDGLWALGGARSFSRWAATEYRWSLRTAQARVRLGRALREDLPLTAQAATAGDVAAEDAQILAALAPTTERRREALADRESECNEAFLVEHAARMPVDQFRLLARHWSAAVDPDADDRGYVEASDREFVQVDRLGDGYHLAGYLTVEHGQTLRAALRAITPVPAADDTRTTGQRRAQALGDLARVVLDHGLTGTGRAVRPHIGVLVPYETMCALAAGAARATPASPEVGSTKDWRAVRDTTLRAERPASRPGVPQQRSAPRLTADMLIGLGTSSGPEFQDGTPVPRALLDRLACDSEINRYVFGPDSELLDVGRRHRTFTGALRTAIIARDRHCRFPGCHAPPAISEGHHVQHWSRDHGSTSVENGILLCWHHHDVVHRKRIEIHRRGKRWVFVDDAGQELTES
ncbi:HNH endonuclease signature motif containing protein [Cellulomonas aerilata]|uniref:HNH nuclease domain-containing protein n=1 Tax=Cellulomonas aerilata TaxID=515326 RepID=A0A512D8I4_9CELL|nr:HNH endonuclease signature motif containing protein [Cellulomonas aerilata]GEO32804.1 hypothetical protein CAE01nite_05290 [Cellulomonas aerilata]